MSCNLCKLFIPTVVVVSYSVGFASINEFKAADIWPYGQIIEITDEDKPKYIVKTFGWRGDPDKKPKDQYKVKVDLKNIFQVNIKFKPGQEDQLKKDGIII